MPKLKGEEHPAARLSASAVKEIRATYVPGQVSQRELAEAHGVSQQMIARVLARTSWKHLAP